MHTYDRQQLVKLAYATGLVKEADAVLGTAAKGLVTDVKAGAGKFVENLLGRNVVKAEESLAAAQKPITALDDALTAEAKAGKSVMNRLGEFAPLQQKLDVAKQGLSTAKMDTSKARLGAGVAGAAGLAGLGGLALYRRAAANAAKKKLLMGAGAAGLGGLALGSAID